MTMLNKGGWKVVPALLLAFCLCSCVNMKDYGSIRGSNEVTEAFRSYDVNSDYKYYTMGPGSYPQAILGIHKDYTLDSKIWTPVEVTPNLMKEWVDLVNLQSVDQSRYWGSNILDNSGNAVGFWYSDWRRGTVKVTEDKMVTVSPDRESGFHGNRAGFKALF